jgi:RloB-like protein
MKSLYPVEWAKVSKSFKRNVPSKNIGIKTLISCEGEKTEQLYFKAIRKDLNIRRELFIILNHKRTDPSGIVEEAIEARDGLIFDKNWVKEDSAWAVFDGDEHINRSLSNWRNAIERAKSQKINLAITNPAIEFWYLLHFQDYSANISSSQAETYLKKYIPTYEKNICYYSKLLKPRTSDACDRASKIYKHSQNNDLDEFSNPCCNGISDLVKRLQNL